MISDSGLHRLGGLALAAGARDLATEVAALEERLREQRFHVACVGQFKRGKSTLLNALVGRGVLPTGIVPVTSVPTILRHGRFGARVRTGEGWSPLPPERLAEVVTEQLNPGNAKGVLAVEVLVPAPILERGLCLVDTPGLGSVFEANTVATREFVPQVDAALVVLGADPPVTGEELRVIEMIAAEADTMVYVLNKADRVTPAECHEAAGFLRTVLRDRLGLTVDRVYQVSATTTTASPDWAALVENLTGLAADSREALVRSAIQRGMSRWGRALSGRVHERLEALTRPVAEYERRVRALAALGSTAERALRELAPLLAAEEQRLEREARARSDAFLQEALPVGEAHLRAEWEQGGLQPDSREAALEAANRIARSLAYAWLRRAEENADTEFRRVVARFRSLADEQVERLVSEAGLPPHAAPVVGSSAGLRARSHFAFSDRTSYHYARTPLGDWLAALLPSTARDRRVRRAAERYLRDLLTVNASRVAGDLAERVRESRRALEAEIRAALSQVADSAAGALEWAQAVRAKGAEEVSHETTRLNTLLGELRGLLEAAGDAAA